MKVINLDQYYPADGVGMEKAKGVYTQVKESGILKDVKESGILKDLVGGIVKKKTSSVEPTPQPMVIKMKSQPTQEEAKKDNTLLYVGIGGGVLVLLGIVIIATRR